MSKEIQVIISAENEAILEKKKAWSEVGLLVHNSNVQLQSMANDAIKLLVIPKTIDEVSNAELTLKEVKSKLNEIETKRKEVTSKFDKVSSALMTHEKMVKDALPAFQQAIIELKKIDEANKAKIKAQEEAKKLAKENAINFVSDEFTRMKDLVATQCQKAFEYALEKNVTQDQLPAYLKKVKANKQMNDFVVVKPEKMNQEDFDYAYKAIDMASPEEMLAYLHKQIDYKFEFYGPALKNKDDAIKASKEAEEKARIEREQELANAKVASRLETISTTMEAIIDNGVKELKKKYALDMPDDEQSALLIATAFITNFGSVKDGVRVTKWMNLSIGQMGNALAWLKNKDDKFEFTGVKFKIDSKL